ncbi:MAG: YfhO family protein [Candidatus Riflebacteria bacterium]|nr:YfhO family protein [Candidatus Riflebacteria bacterium]
MDSIHPSADAPTRRPDPPDDLASWSRPGIADLGIAALLAIVILAWLWPYPLLGLSWEGTDNFLTGRPYMLHALDRMREGRLPLWNPYLACGTSFLAQASFALDPFNLFGLLPPAHATMLLLSVQLWLAALGAFLLSRLLGCGRQASLVAALAYASSSWSVNLVETRIYAAALVWQPFVLAAIVHATRSPSFRAVVLASVPLSLGILGAYPHQWPMLLAVTVLGALAEPIRAPWVEASLRRLVVVGAVLVLSFLQTAVYTLPCVEAFALSNRGRLDTAVGGNPTQLEALVQLVLSPVAFNLGPVGMGYGTSPPIVVLCLLGLCAGAGGASGRLGLLLAIPAALVLVEPGRTVVSALLGPTGPLGRFGLLWAMGTSLLASAGAGCLRALWTAGGGAPSRSPTARLLGLGVRWFLATLGVAAAGLASRPGATIFGQPAPAYLTLSLLQFDAGITWGAGLLALSAIAWVRTGGARPGQSVRATVLVVAGVLVVFGLARFGVRARYDCPPPDRLLEGLLARPFDGASDRTRTVRSLCTPLSRRSPDLPLDPYRVAPLIMGSPYDERSSGGITGVGSRVPLFYNAGMVERILTPCYYGPFLNQETAEFIHALTLGHRQTRGCGLAVVSSLHPVLLKLDRIPRAFVVSRARLVETADRRLAGLGDTGFDPLGVCLVEKTEGLSAVLARGELPPGPADPRDRADILSYDPERVVIRSTASRPGMLVLTDSFERGWKATVDGRPATIYRVDHCFRGISLDAGSHVVEFAYEPLPFAVGWWLTALGLVGSAVLALRT